MSDCPDCQDIMDQVTAIVYFTTYPSKVNHAGSVVDIHEKENDSRLLIGSVILEKTTLNLRLPANNHECSAQGLIRSAEMKVCRDIR